MLLPYQLTPKGKAKLGMTALAPSVAHLGGPKVHTFLAELESRIAWLAMTARRSPSAADTPTCSAARLA